MTTHHRRRIALALGALAALAIAAPATAHPLGNFTINQYSAIELRPGAACVRYVVDMAEIPALQERQRIDTDRDGTISTAESDTYLAAEVPELLSGLRLTLDEKPVELRPLSRSLTFPEGQAGLTTLRLELDLAGTPAAAATAATLRYADDNFAQRQVGWREIVVTSAAGVTVTGSDAPTTDLSDQLRRYPEELLATPIDKRTATATVSIPVGGAGSPCGAVTPEPTGAGGAPGIPAPAVPGGLSDLERSIIGTIQGGELTPPVILAALGLAALLGAQHALTPGHGKTVMAAYLVGTRGTIRHALGLGLTVTISHTLGVLGLGAVTLFAASVLPPERLFPILGLVSGVIVIGIGLYLLAARLRDIRRARALAEVHGHDHGHEHGHDHGGHDHAEGHDHDHAEGHDHDHAEGHAHGTDHGHDHGHADHDHPHDHDHAAAGEHSHGLIRHSHLPRDLDAPLSWRGLFALGLAGGLVPSIPALLLLLGSIGLGRPAYGIVLTIVFGLGMAVVLVGVGILLVHARGLLERLPVRVGGSRLSSIVPLATACVVLVAGVVLTAQALARPGL